MDSEEEKEALMIRRRRRKIGRRQRRGGGGETDSTNFTYEHDDIICDQKNAKTHCQCTDEYNTDCQQCTVSNLFYIFTTKLLWQCMVRKWIGQIESQNHCIGFMQKFVMHAFTSVHLDALLQPKALQSNSSSKFRAAQSSSAL